MSTIKITFIIFAICSTVVDESSLKNTCVKTFLDMLNSVTRSDNATKLQP